MSYGPSSTLGLAYVGVNAPTPPNVFVSDRAPTTGDWRNQMVGNMWIDNIHDNAYILVSLAMNMAVWNLAAASTGDLSTLTPNTGGVVSPTLANINLVGDGTTITTTGNPGTSTITISAVGATSTSFVTDAGTAVPVADVLNVLGGTNINTAGSGNTVTTNLDAAIVLTSVSTATQAPIADSMLISGNTITATGTAPTVGINLAAKGSGSNVITTQNTTTTFGSNNVTFSATSGQIALNSQSVLLNTVATGGGTLAPTAFWSSATINTTNNTPTTIFTVNLGSGQYSSFDFFIQAFCSTTGTDALFARVFASSANFSASSLTLIGTPVIDINTTNLSATVSVTISGGTSFNIVVTGITAQTWEWTAAGLTFVSQ